MLIPSFTVSGVGVCVDFCEECVGCGKWFWVLAGLVVLVEIL